MSILFSGSFDVVTPKSVVRLPKSIDTSSAPDSKRTGGVSSERREIRPVCEVIRRDTRACSLTSWRTILRWRDLGFLRSSIGLVRRGWRWTKREVSGRLPSSRCVSNERSRSAPCISMATPTQMPVSRRPLLSRRCKLTSDAGPLNRALLAILLF